MRKQVVTEGRSPEAGSGAGFSLLGIYQRLSSGWPRLVLWSMLGAVVFAAYASAAGRAYQASAVVAVHHNVRQAYPQANEREVASILDQETALLEAVSYSDALWSGVREQIGAEGWLRTPEDGRRLIDSVRLPHPMDGAWQFVAESEDPALAARLANVWAAAFVDEVNRGVIVAQRQEALALQVQGQTAGLLRERERCVQLDRSLAEVRSLRADLGQLSPSAPADLAIRLQLAREAARSGIFCTGDLACPVQSTVGDETAFSEVLEGGLQDAIAACQAATQALEAELAITVDAAAENASERLAVSPWIEVSLTQEAVVPDSPEIPLAGYLLAGVAAGTLAWIVGEWRASLRNRRDEGVA
jgi:hypothetical protein